MLKLCLLLSGGLGLDCLAHIFNGPHPIVAVFTDKGSEAIQTFCAQREIPVFVGNPRNGRAAGFIADKTCDVLFSINYLFIVEKDLIDWPSKYAINIHGSLLPKYRGRTPHVWAIINGETQTGATAHLILPDVDSGDIVHQTIVPISSNDTGNDILQKFKHVYPQIIATVLQNIDNGKLERLPQDPALATYFGKRTPADGHINWSWQRDRIRNWVRAQAHPYPGAFTCFEEKKIIVNRASHSQAGFHSDMPNGYILAYNAGQLTVKTPNGALDLSELNWDGTMPHFAKGQILA